ncbi:glycine-rich domain-containing protein [Devosia crocina]
MVWTTPGTYTWTVPEGVTSICAVCVGAGGTGESRANIGGSPQGGGGGGLAWGNDIPVTPGQVLNIVVGAAATSGRSGSTILHFDWLIATGGNKGGSFGPAPPTTDGTGGTSGGTKRQGGGSGGTGGHVTSGAGGGGGAGGYSGDGGRGGGFLGDFAQGQGGGGAGGQHTVSNTAGQSRGGGGVGIYGEGQNGLISGGGGSGGQNSPLAGGGNFGGGSGSRNNSSVIVPGASGAIRIIWGEGRAFPSTDTGSD